MTARWTSPVLFQVQSWSLPIVFKGRGTPSKEIIAQNPHPNLPFPTAGYPYMRSRIVHTLIIYYPSFMRLSPFPK